MTRTADSLARLHASVASIPEMLQRALCVPLPVLGASPRTVVTTGIGASEGPARMLAETLAQAGIASRFCSTSSFIGGGPTGDLLVVFSQGLSPNARLALKSPVAFQHRWVVTSASADAGADAPVLRAMIDAGVVPIIVTSPDERGLLVRLAGPTVATLVALRLAAQLRGDPESRALLDAAPSAYRSLLEFDVPLDVPVALIGAGVTLDSMFGHRWKLLESLLIPDPPVWDVLQLAHGPLQSFYGRAATLLVFEHRQASALADRLERTIEPTLHRVVRLRATAAEPLEYFQFAATLDKFVVATLARTPCDLFAWPGQGRDEPLYGLGGD